MHSGKRKIIIKILAAAAVFAVLAAGAFYVIQTHTIQTVYVEGNVHYTEDEIKSFVMEGFLGNNSLYLSLKYKNC